MSQPSSSTLVCFIRRWFGTASANNTPPPKPSAMDQAAARVRELVDANPAFVFSKSWCNFSGRAKQTLNQHGVVYGVLELDYEDNEDALQDALYSLTGQYTVPNIFIGGKHIGGNSDLQRLDREKKLLDKLRGAGALGNVGGKTASMEGNKVGGSSL